MVFPASLCCMMLQVKVGEQCCAGFRRQRHLRLACEGCGGQSKRLQAAGSCSALLAALYRSPPSTSWRKAGQDCW